MKARYLFLAALLTIVVLPSLEAQAKKRLAILPFSGGSGQDGETVSILLASQPALFDVFTVLPRNSAIDSIMGEQQFQRQSGLINSDAISRIGQMNTADFVVSGHIAKLTDTNLIIISIIDVTEIQQVAGVYRTYKTIEDVRGLLPGMSRSLADASRKNFQNLPGLAIPSFYIPQNVNSNDAMVLAQILATEIVNLGKYAVFPRNSSMEDVIKEHQFQRSGQTAGAKVLGTSQKIDFILSSSVVSLGNTNLFASQILDIEGGNLVKGADRSYQNISDGINKNLMKELADELISGKPASANVLYSAHLSGIGWTRYYENGATAGTTGQSRQMEAIKIRVNSDIAGGICYNAHIQSLGWIGWKYDDNVAGTTGQSKRMEAIQIQLTGELANRYNVRYRVHIGGRGWSGWVSNGATAGTTGQSRQLEAIEIQLEPK